MNLNRSEKLINSKIMIALLWIGAILVNIKSIFTDFGQDQAYALATSYRHILGDRMFEEMWEPHQTSSFISDFVLLLYSKLMHSYDGIAICEQLIGVILYAVVTIVFLKFLLKKADYFISNIICILFFASRAKLLVYPEFSNMQVAFGVLLFIALMEFFDQQDKYIYLVISSICLSLQVLSYPSCVISLIGIIVLLCIYATNKLKSISILVGVCICLGVSYISFFVYKIGFSQFAENIKNIFFSDSSHVGNSFSLWVFLRGTVYGIIWLVALYFITILLNKIMNKGFYSLFFILATLSDLGIMILADKYSYDWIFVFGIFYAVLIVLGICNIKYTDNDEKRMWISSFVISLSAGIAVLLLTNQEFLSVFFYMILVSLISFIPIYKSLDKKINENLYIDMKRAICLFTVFILCHRMIAIYGYMNASGKYLLTDIENVIRKGPNKGIVTILSKVDEVTYSVNDFILNTQKYENVLVVNKNWIEPTAYFYNDNNVSTYSTIDTPTYNESLEKYWNIYPNKRPDVIAVKAWDGIENRDYDGWIADLLEHKYELTNIGTGWHFYRKKK